MAAISHPVQRTAPILGGMAFAIAGAALGLLFALLLVGLIATQFFGFRVLTVQSSSMAPTFSRGDVAIVKPVALADVKSGDVIVFEVAGGRAAVAHRVVQVGRTVLNVTDSRTGEVETSITYQFRTKGDANDRPDAAMVNGSDVLGSVWHTFPGVGTGFTSLRPLLVALTTIVGLSWLIWEVRHHFRGKAEKAA